MIEAYCLLTGIAILLFCLLNIDSLEAMVVSVVIAVLSMYVGGAIGNFQFSIYLLMILGGLGIFFLVLNFRKRKRSDFLSPGFLILTALLLLSILAFTGDYISSIDDFHQWAAAVRFMLTRDSFPIAGEFLGSSNTPLGTSLFHLISQKLGGYNEGNMFASAQLLIWTGFLLPIGRCTWKEWKRVALYVTLLFVGLFSLYVHPYKSLYVDLPVSSWAAGLCLWWLGRHTDWEKRNCRKGLIVVLAAGLFFVADIKWAVGLLFDAFVLFFILMIYLYEHGLASVKEIIQKNIRKILLILVPIVAIMILWSITASYSIIPGSMNATIEAVTLSSEKAQKTFLTMVTNCFGKTLHSSSNLKIVFVPFLIFICLMLAAFEEKKRAKMQILFLVICGITYLMVLYITYVSTFSYEESINNAAIHRYFSIYAVFGFSFLAASITLQRKNMIVAIVLLCIFGYGINQKFVSSVSSIDSESITGYKSIKKAGKLVEELKQYISETDKVYFINQAEDLKSIDEYAMSAILYYEENQVSNYTREPWKYTEKGCLVFVRSEDEHIEALPERLKEGGYTYIWAYSVDDYLNEVSENVFQQDSIQEGGLYQISFDSDDTITLKLAAILK